MAETRDPAAVPRPVGVDFRTGLLTNLLNPKVALFICAFPPQFVPVATPDTTGSFPLLGTWFVARSLVFMMALVALASRQASVNRSGTAQRWLAGLNGLLFIGLALRLLRDRPGLA